MRKTTTSWCSSSVVLIILWLAPLPQTSQSVVNDNADYDADVYAQSIVNGDGTVERSLAAVVRADRVARQLVVDYDQEKEMPNDEPSEDGPLRTVVGVIGLHAELLCNVQPKVRDDQLQLVLWYKKGRKSPIYTFDAREKPILTYASHYSPVFGQRASMRVPNRSSKEKVAVLVIQHLRAEDEGLYKCRADFKKSPTKNNRMYLSMLVPPKKPTIYDANGRKMTTTLGPFKVGDELIATCITTGGTPPPRLTWWQEHALIDDTYEIVNNRTTNTLRLPNVQRKDLNVVFTCQAINNNQSAPVATKLRLDLTFPPLAVNLVTDRRKALSADKEERLECRCRGSRPAPVFRWYVGNRELDSTSHDKMSVEHHVDEVKAEEWTSAIFRYVPKAEDNGKYLMCKVTNEYYPEKTKEDGYIINVNYVPVAMVTFGRSLNPKDIREGADVYFECHVRSNPHFYNITWRNNGKFLIEHVAKGVIIGNQTLVLQNVKREDAGLYTCVASNSEGDGESNAQYLDIKFAPTCQQGQRIVYGAAFKTETIVSCHVEANPMPHTFRWQFKTANQRRRTDLINTVGGENVLDNIKDMVDLPSNHFTLEYDHSLLKYRAMTVADYGYLYCWAENSAGEQEEPCRFEIVRESSPEPLTKCRTVNVTWEMLETLCNEGFDGGHFPTYHLEVYRTDVIGKQYLAYNLSSNERPHFQLLGLEPGTDFSLVAFASNELGTSEKVLFNATTLNLAEKRTAETRSKLSPIVDDPQSVGMDADAQQIEVDPGLALLPIVAILCGVGIGLGTVALGVVLIVRGRGDEDNADVSSDERHSNGNQGGSVAGINATSGGRYDAVCTSPSDEIDIRTAKNKAEHYRAELGDSFDSDQQQQQQQHHHHHHHHGSSNSGTLTRMTEVSSVGSGSLGRSSSTLTRRGHHHHSHQTSALRHDESHHRHSQSVSRQGTLQRSVRFEDSPPSGHQLVHVELTQALLDESLPLPQPPATFSDPPTSPEQQMLPLPAGGPQQLLRIQPQSPSRLANVDNVGGNTLENSFVTFCPPNLETKTRDIVNATRL